MPEILTIREAAIRLGVRPRDLHDRFYDGRLPDDLAIPVGGKRAIPASNLTRIAAALRRSGLTRALDDAQRFGDALDTVADSGGKLMQVANGG